MSSLEIVNSCGKPLPYGATLNSEGTRFSVFSRHATGVSLLLYDQPGDAHPSHVIDLDPQQNRTGDVWHVQANGIGTGAYYLYRAFGPYKPEKGHRFNANRLLLDPYAKAIAGHINWELSELHEESPSARIPDASAMPKCIVINNDFDWQDDKPLNYPLRFSIIYETHLRGLTVHQSSKVKHPGTYRGVIETIPYFKELGITSLELLPIQEFSELEKKNYNPLSGERLRNYWGYNTVAFFAPKASYSSSGSIGRQVKEFKEMVRELHKAGIEVILDVVFNHTAEGDETGSTFCFKGWDNSIYYILDDDPRYYRNFTGCGNTFNCNHPTVRTFILDCLHYWVVEMHVDGFRFDLGSVLSRDRQGNIMENPPILERIAEDPILRNTKIIAEAWDAAGAYQVGEFPGGRWAEWNDHYRNDVRRFWRGDPGTVANLATRITGSSDLYLRDGRKPFHSVNFITSHDGFTLNDLNSYNRKHNKANGENNQDGTDENLSCNYGVEGDTDDPAVLAVRNRQVKNFLATLILSLGTPMLLGGDEFRRTQKGNNNAYCQNNEISWYNWDLKEKHGDIYLFCKELIAFRQRHPAFHRPEFYSGKDSNHNTIPDITWYGVDGCAPNWGRHCHTLALRIDGSKAEIAADRDDNDFFIMLNASGQNANFSICDSPKGRKWHRAIDTALESPNDISKEGCEAVLQPQNRYTLAARSMVVLLSR